jgi:hypothetical protein
MSDNRFIVDISISTGIVTIIWPFLFFNAARAFKINWAASIVIITIPEIAATDYWVEKGPRSTAKRFVSI